MVMSESNGKAEKDEEDNYLPFIRKKDITNDELKEVLNIMSRLLHDNFVVFDQIFQYLTHRGIYVDFLISLDPKIRAIFESSVTNKRKFNFHI